MIARLRLVATLVTTISAAAMAQPVTLNGDIVIVQDPTGSITDLVGMNNSSTDTKPSPSHVSHRPCATLNEKRPAVYRRACAAFVAANILRTWSNKPV